MSTKGNAPVGAEASGGAIENSATADSSVIVQQDAEACRARVAAVDKTFQKWRARFAMAGFGLRRMGVAC